MTLLEHFSPTSAPRYSASKWIHLPFLIGTEDFEALFSCLGESFFLRSSGVYSQDSVLLSSKQFLLNWENYLRDLISGPVNDALYKPYFSLFWSASANTLGLIDVRDGHVCATQTAPNIVLQLHRFQYSTVDKTFRRQVFGSDTISWGVQVSFPMLMQDPKTREIKKTLLDESVINRALWITLQKWLKSTTRPITFETADVTATVPFRISKSCMNWIDQHYELKSRGIRVKQ